MPNFYNDDDDYDNDFFWALRLKLSLKFLLTEAPTIICLILYLISGAKPDQKITRSFLFRVKDGKRMHFPLGFIRKNCYACLTTPAPCILAGLTTPAPAFSLA